MSPRLARESADRVREVLHSRAGGPLRAAYTAVTNTQLAAFRLRDTRLEEPPAPLQRAEAAGRVTFAVKTFQRPDVARRLVRSLRPHFSGRIVIADDSRQPMAAVDPLVTVLAMPFNSGVSVGRNAALDAVETEFTFVADDDIVFSAALGLTQAMAYLDATPEADIVGIMRVELPRWYAIDHGPDALFPGRPPLRPWGDLVNGLPVRQMIEQVYLARTASLQRVRWDERLRMVDHRDFFSRAAGRLVTVWDSSHWAYHARTPFDPGYTAYREDTRPDLELLGRIWSVANPPVADG